MHRAEPKRSGDPGPNRIHLGLEHIMLGMNPLGPHYQSFAFGGQTLETVSPVDQRDVQLALQFAIDADSAGWDTKHFSAARAK